MRDVRVTARERPRCPFCKDEVVGGHVWLCPACAAPHHADCLREHGACSTCGAPDEAPPPPVAAQPPPPPLPPPAVERAEPVWQPDKAGDLPSPLRAAAQAMGLTVAGLVLLFIVVGAILFALRGG